MAIKFIFEDKEVACSSPEYRMAIVDLPQDFYINYLEMGLYESSQVMLRDFSFSTTH